MGSSYESAKNLMRSGPSRPTLYEVDIDTSQIPDTRTNDYIKLFCRAANIPGLSHDYVEMPGQVNHGIMRKIPFMSVYGNNAPLVFQIVENTDWSVYTSLTKLYEDVINNSNTNRGVMRANYFDSYKFDMYLRKLEFADDKSTIETGDVEQYKTAFGYKTPISWKFYNCYLTSISDIPLSNEAIDQPLNFGFGVMYDKFSYVKGYNEEDRFLDRAVQLSVEPFND